MCSECQWLPWAYHEWYRLLYANQLQVKEFLKTYICIPVHVFLYAHLILCVTWEVDTYASKINIYNVVNCVSYKLNDYSNAYHDTIKISGGIAQ